MDAFWKNKKFKNFSSQTQGWIRHLDHKDPIASNLQNFLISVIESSDMPSDDHKRNGKESQVYVPRDKDHREKISVCYVQSRNSVKPDRIIISYDHSMMSSKTCEIVYMEANYHTWNASWKVSGLDEFLEYVSGLGIPKSESYGFLQILFTYCYSFPTWSSRQDIVFPKALMSTGDHLPKPSSSIRSAAQDWQKTNSD